MIRRVPRPLRSCLWLALLLCGTWLTQLPAAASHRSTDETQAHSTVSAQNRAEIFDKVWKEINQHYYDPAFNGVNWLEIRKTYEPQVAAASTDDAFYSLLKRMVSELHDAHTRFNTPLEWALRKKRAGVSFGFAVEEVDGKTVVSFVHPDSGASSSGVEPGMFIVSMDDKPFGELLAETKARQTHNSSERADQLLAYRVIFSGPLGSSSSFIFQRADGSLLKTSLTRETFSQPLTVESHPLPSGIGYIRFDEFLSTTPREFKNALQRLRTAPGIVIDLRANGGGTLNSMLSMAGFLLPEKTLFVEDRTRSGKPFSEFAGLFHVPLKLYAGREGDQIYSGPVVILVRARTASAAEIFSAGLQDAHRAEILGTQTCGCVLGIAKTHTFKGGSVLEISEILWLSPKGRRLEGEGVLPDREIRPTIEDLRSKRDAPLAEAEKSLLRLAMTNSPHTSSSKHRE